MRSPRAARLLAAALLAALAAACTPVWHFETLDGSGASNPGSQPGSVSAPAVALFGGVPHVFYVANTGADLRHAWWTGTAWAYEALDGPGATTTVGRSATGVQGSIAAIEYASQLHVFYMQCVSGTTSCSGNRVLRHAGTSPFGWAAETLDGQTSSVPGHTAQSSGFDNSAVVFGGQLHAFTVGCAAACGVATWDSLKHLWWDGAQWRIEALDGIGATVALGRDTARAVSFGANTSAVLFGAGPHAFYRQDSSSPGDGRLRHAWWDGARWRAETLDGPGGVATGAVADDTGYNSAALVHGAGPYVAYRGCSATCGGSGQGLRIARWDGAAWVAQTLDGPGGGVAAGGATNPYDGDNAVLVSGGEVHVWANSCNLGDCLGTSNSHRLRHAWLDGSTWRIETLDGPGSTWPGAVTARGEGMFSKAVALYRDEPHVFYVGSPSDTTFGQSLRHAWYGG